MIIRKAQIEDLEQLAILFNGYRVFYEKEPDIKSAKQFLNDRIKAEDSKLYVAEMLDGSLVGFTQLYPLFSSTRMKRLWLLNDLYVDASHRGKGISILLIERAKQLVIETNACGMYLETGKTNLVGNKLYPRIGFSLNETSYYYEWHYK